MRFIPGASLLVLMTLSGAQSTSAPVQLLNRPDSFKFAVLGDSGTGEPAQSELAAQAAALRERFKFDDVILLGDNIQGNERPQDFVRKFEAPYKTLLDGGVRFHAALGEHDSREQRYYKLFNMQGNLFYTFTPRSDVQFFALESTYPDQKQVQWLEAQLQDSPSSWKIVLLHHPLYSSGRRHGSDVRLRGMIEPLLLKYNVSVVFGAHDNVYERTTPQSGITHFVVGSSGKVRQGDLDRRSPFTASGFDTDLAFLAAEIVGDHLYFNALSRTGQVVDSGVLARRK